MQSFLLTVAMLRGNVVLLITISFLVNRSSGAVDRKVENIKQYILNQLAFSQPPPNASDSAATPKDKLTEYRMQMHREDSANKYCNELDTHAKNILTMGGQAVALLGSSESGSGVDKRGNGIKWLYSCH